MQRVVATGLGVVSPLGVGREAFWQALCGMASPRTRACSIPFDRIQPDVKHARTMGRIARFAMKASELALEDGRIEPRGSDAENLGIFLGTNLDDINLLGVCRAFSRAGRDPGTGEPDLARFVPLALETLHPFDYLQALSNLPAAHVAIRWEARGMNCSYVSHGISGAEAIGEAYLAVRDGVVEYALAGGADSWLTPFAVWRRGIFSGVPFRPCTPFSEHRTSPRLGEGAAILLLERLEAAQSRNARIYGEISGYAKALEAEAFPYPCPSAGLARCMRFALARAGLIPAGIDYLSAHGEGSVESDRIEAHALQEVFGSEGLPPIRAVKRMIGHLGAASGALESAATLLAIHRQWLPPFPDAETADLASELERTDRAARPARIGAALNIAFHPMGLCASLVFKDIPESSRGREGPL